MSEPGAADGQAGIPAPEVAAADAERRLHPMSWLFVLLQQLRQFIVPLLALVVVGRGSDDGYGYGSELWPLVGVGALAVVSVWQYFTYRYGVSGDALVVRSGLFERSVRVIPFARIHNVALQQSLLHRLVGVAEVRLESAGGAKPEAEMRVLKLEDALALEQLVRHRGAVATETMVEPATTPLLAMDTGEVLRLGLVSNRGMILVAAAFGGMWQVPGLRGELFEGWGEAAFGWAEGRQFGPAEYALAAASLLMLAVVALRLLSMLMALLQYHGFALRELGKRLTVERGLLNRWRTSASRRRIQAWTLEEGVLHRLLKRRSLSVDTAVSQEQQHQQRALRELAPIATPAAGQERVDRLDHALARAPVAVRMDRVAVVADRLHQLRRPRQRAGDGGLELRGVVDVDQLRARAAVPERHHRLAGQQELVERRRGVRAHHVHLREQVEDVVILRVTQVRALQCLELRHRPRVHLRVEGDDPLPAPVRREALHFLVQRLGRAP